MLTNFPTPKTYNQGGLRSFKFLHRNAVNVWPGIFNSKILLPIVLNEGFVWLNGYATPLTLAYAEDSKDNENGNYYEQQIVGFAPGDKLELINLMEQMANNNFIVLIKDTNNQTRLVGSHGYPLTFSAVYNSGAGREEAKGYNFKFSGVSIFRAPVYL